MDRHEEANQAARKALQETTKDIENLGYYDIEDQKCMDLVKYHLTIMLVGHL
jgi:hypothetical protein